jgi:hypothetical protein
LYVDEKILMTHKNWYLLIYLLLLTLILAACQRGSSGDIPEIGINLSVSPDPPAVGTATVILNLTNADNQPITGATIELEGNMSHAGMVPVFSQATEQKDGQYEAPLEFTMAGDWFILVKATLPDGRKLERQIDVPGVETR